MFECVKNLFKKKPRQGIDYRNERPRKIALIIGHSEQSTGALSRPLGSTEYEYYQFLRDFKIVNPNVQTQVFDRNKGWSSLVEKLKIYKPYATIEFHFNIGGGRAHGVECLSKIGDLKSYEIADQMCLSYSQKFNKQNRGVRLVGPRSQGYNKGRGHNNLYQARKAAPRSVLFEAFFGDNSNDVITTDQYSMWLDYFIENL